MAFTVVTSSHDSRPDIEKWLEYCSARDYTPDILAPCGGEILTLDKAADLLGQGVFAYRRYGISALYVFPVGDGYYQGRIVGELQRPEVAKPGENVKVTMGKYYKPSGSPNVLYIPRHRSDWFDPKHEYDLVIVESPLAANYLNYHGIYAVATGGIWNFNIAGKNSPMMPRLKQLVEAEHVNRIVLIPDSDTDPETRPDLAVAVGRVSEAILKLRGSRSDTLHIVRPPSKENGDKLGPDDYLCRVGIDEFSKWLREAPLKVEDMPFLRIQRTALSRFIFDETSNRCWDEKNRQLIELTHFDSIMATHGKAFDITAATPKLVTYNYKHFLSAPGLRIAQGLKFQPDEESTYFLDQKLEPPLWKINKFHPDDMPRPIKGDVSIAYEILNSLCRDSPSAPPLVLSILARHAQFPAAVPKYAILFTGEQRAGKSNFARLCGLALSKRYHNARVDLATSFNSTWRGYACKEWPEFDRDMDEEWLKDLITSETYEVQTKYGANYVEHNYTLNLFTCNGLQSKIQEGDRRFVICGYAKRDNQRLGLEFEKWIAGPGPNYFRYHLLNEVDCSNYDWLNNWTEMQDSVIEASQSYRATVKDLVLQELNQVEGLELVPNNVLEILLTPHKVSTIAFNKAYGHYFVKPKLDVVKVDGYPQRFRAFKNQDKWRLETDTEKYRDQYAKASQLVRNKKF